MKSSDKKVNAKTVTSPLLSKTKIKPADALNEFAENIINTVWEPLLILDKNLRVVKASQSFFNFFKVSPDETIGTLIYNLGNGQWDIPKLRELLETILPEKTTFNNYEVEHVFSTIGKRVMLLNARQIVRTAGKEKIILLAIEDITERKQIENGLEKTRKELVVIKKSADEISEFAENLIDTVREPLLALDQNLRIVKASQSFFDFFKVSADVTIGTLIYNLGNGQWDIPKLRELLETILPEKTTFDNYEVEHVFSTIGRRVMLLNARQIDRAFGKEKIILLAIEDITERKQKEESLSEVNRMTHEYVDILFNHAHAPIIIWDSSMVIIHINHAFEKLSGYDWSELKDKHIDILFPADKIDSTLKLINNSLQRDERNDLIIIEILKKDNERKTVLWNPAYIFDKDGNEIVATIAQDITSRTHMENELITSETRLRTLVNTIPDLVWVKDVDGIFLSCNKMFCSFFGAAESEIVGKSDYDFVDKNLADFFRENDRKAMAAGKPTSNEEWITFADDGHRAYLETIKAPMYNSENKIIGILGIGRDITDRQNAEQKIQESEEKHRALIEQMYEGLFEVDNDDVIQFVNPMFCKMLGYEETELIGKVAHKILQKENESIKIIDKNLNRMNGVTEQYEWCMINKSGEQIDLFINAVPVRDKSGKVIGSLSTCIDITERKRAAEEITMLAHSLKSVNECVSITDLNNKIIFINESFLRTYGYEENELIGQNINILRSLNNQPELVNEIFPATIRGEWTGELLNKRKDGSEFPIYLSTTTIKDKDGIPLGLIGVATNISDRKQNEKDLVAAKDRAEQSDKLKSEFLTQMSHEIRTPLNAIVGYADYLNETLSENLDSDSRNCFEGIQLASNRIIRTVDLILNISELNTSGYIPHFKTIDLNLQVLNKLYREHKRAAKQKGLEFTYTCEEKDLNVIADEYSVTQIFSNLVDNAIKYTKTGKVEILLKKNKSGNIIVEVRDTGIGISKEFLPRIFEPFAQEEQGYNRSFDGTGLGLVLVKKYCDINIAYIEIESEKNVGSTFRIIFYNRIIEA